MLIRLHITALNPLNSPYNVYTIIVHVLLVNKLRFQREVTCPMLMSRAETTKPWGSSSVSWFRTAVKAWIFLPGVSNLRHG